ncbi:hypothetical protein G9A89_005686 [Geosiphon pyriformis]|nr:hypothetical protein G9A89_005686 [Geosiphon pyriformis]
MAKDLITEIMQDHQAIKDLYGLFLGEINPDPRQGIAEKIICEANTHTFAEEIVVYPAYEQYIPDNGTRFANDSRDEHEQLKKLLYELYHKRVTDEDYYKKMAYAMEAFGNHMKEEEEVILPIFKKYVTTEILKELGRRFLDSRRTVSNEVTLSLKKSG